MALFRLSRSSRPEKWRFRFTHALVLVAVLLGLFRSRPEILFWPHHVRIGVVDVYSEQPLTPRLHEIVRNAVALRASSPIAGPLSEQRVFLTDGSLRWHVLALASKGAFAISVSFSEAIIVNRNSVEQNKVRNGASLGGFRPLDRVLAHEMMHGVLRQHFGEIATQLKPVWLIEGYCDYIAQDSSLGLEEYRTIKASGESHPALPYYEGRQRITHLIEREGLSIQEIFSRH